MSADPQKAREVFLHAVGSLPPERWDGYVAERCGGDAELEQQVQRYLQIHRGAGSFLEEPVGPPWPTTDAHWHDPPDTVIGPYKLLEPIGEGGFGVVFMAEQSEPVRRKVALKVLKAGMDTRQVVARFEAERQALALMEHPNIARVFDGGTTPSGRPYFVMELVRGVPITELCDQARLGVHERLGLFIDVCSAVQHAHHKGIIHRDLKPSNVLVTMHDDKPVVKVIDFGVAKCLGQSLTEKTLFTGFAQMVGTPLYMSPEQAQMSGLDVDTRSDVYALGVLLYELLTGTTPFDRERLHTVGYDEMRRIIREEEPPRPSARLSTLGEAATVSARRGSDPKHLRQVMRGELDWIVMKALEKDRNRRYETANALAADVRRYLNDEAVQACPPSLGYRLGKFARRNKAGLLTAFAVVLAISLAVGVSSTLVWQALERERREANFHRITLAHRELSGDNLALALKLLEECPADLREWEWHYLMRLCRVEPVVLREKSEVNGVAFGPDGERLAAAYGNGTVKIWNSRTTAVVLAFPAHQGTVVSVAFHPDGRHLATRGADLQVKVWDLTDTAQAVFTELCDATRKFGTAYTIAFSADGRMLAAGSNGEVRVWDWKSHQLLHRLPGHNFHSIPVAFSREGRLATGSFREPLRLWNPEKESILRTIDVHDHPVSALAFSPDGTRLASASFDRTVKLLDAKTGKILHSFDLHTGNVECVAFSPDGRRLASGGEDKTVRVWDATTGRELLGLQGHVDRCSCVTFSRDGRLASASSDGTIRIWDGTPLRGDERGQELLTFTAHSDEIRGVEFVPDSSRARWVASASTDGFVKVWDAQTGRVSTEFSGHRDLTGRQAVVFHATWHPEGQRLASAGVETVRVWDARTAREVFALSAGQGTIALPYQAVAFSPDGRHLVTGRTNGTVQVWDGNTGQEVGTLGTHEREVRTVVFSRDGKHLASASSGGIVKLWDATRLDVKRLGEKNDARLTLRARVRGASVNVAFSPDGRRLATGGEENTVKIWDVQSGRELHTLRGHTGEVYAVAISPDGRWVSSAGEDSTVKVWDSQDEYRLAHSFRGHTGLVSGIAFSPDSRLLVSGSRDRTVKVWDLTPLSKASGR